MTKAEETTNPNAESEDNTQVADAGVPGQIQYPDREVDAEHAAAYAGGKEEHLYEDPDDPRNETWENPADTRTTEQRRADAEDTEDDTDE
jgi:hypothetical protein